MLKRETKKMIKKSIFDILLFMQNIEFLCIVNSQCFQYKRRTYICLYSMWLFMGLFTIIKKGDHTKLHKENKYTAAGTFAQLNIKIHLQWSTHLQYYQKFNFRRSKQFHHEIKTVFPFISGRARCCEHCSLLPLSLSYRKSRSAGLFDRDGWLRKF